MPKAAKTSGRAFSFKPNLLSLAVATASGLMVAQAQAQQGADEEAAEDEPVIEEVLVTGFRRSLQDAMRIKRESVLIVEAISAEDIGKLPDNSIAESLTRLTGLAGQRLNGRQQVISIRGLAPDFSTALLNGRQQVSSGDNRGVEFDQYPSELMSGVVVYKTPSPSLSGQGLAGTVDMRTVNPLEHGERTIAANFRYVWNQEDALNPESPNDGERYSLAYIDQFADDTLGVALGFSHISSPGQRQIQDVWGFQNYAGAGGAALMTGAVVKAQSSVLDRNGLMAVLEYAPSDRFTSKADIYYSKFEETTLSRQVSFPVYPPWNGAYPGVQLTTYQAEDGLVTSGTFEPVKAVLGNNLDERDSDLWALGWNLTGELTDAWSATLDVGYSTIDRTDLVLALNSGTGRGRLWRGPVPGEGALDTLSFTRDEEGALIYSGRLDYSQPGLTVLTSPMGWGNLNVVPNGQMGYVNRRTIDDELAQIRLSAERYLEFGPVSGVQFGMQYDKRTKSHVITDEQGFLDFVDGSKSKSFTSSGVVAVPFGISGINTFDPLETYNSGIYKLIPNYHGGVLQNDWEVTEKILLGYAQFNIDSSLGAMPVTGNFGLQVVSTDQSSTGTGARNGQNLTAAAALQSEVTGGVKYTEYLPSLNLSVEVAEQRFIRFGAARTLARARMDDMRAGRAVNFNPARATSGDLRNSPWGGQGGNPVLKPWVANSIDLSFEWYFPDGLGYMALAGFYKDLRTYIYERSILVDFSGFPTGDVQPVLRQGFVTRPDNGEGGELKGLEFSLSVSGEMLAPVLQGFGAVFNASLTESEIDRGTGDPSTPLPGLSKEVANLTLYYERGGFSARVNSNYRSDFLGEVAGFGAARTARSMKSEQLLDAQVSYAFDTGRLAGLTLYVQGTNLTDEPFVTYVNDNKAHVKDYQLYGRTWLVGLSYRN